MVSLLVLVGRLNIKLIWYFSNPSWLFILTIATPTRKPACPCLSMSFHSLFIFTCRPVVFNYPDVTLQTVEQCWLYLNRNQTVIIKNVIFIWFIRWVLKKECQEDRSPHRHTHSVCFGGYSCWQPEEDSGEGTEGEGRGRETIERGSKEVGRYSTGGYCTDSGWRQWLKKTERIESKVVTEGWREGSNTATLCQSRCKKEIWQTFIEKIQMRRLD